MPSPPPVFDADHPPSEALADECVHCGFCLPTCPTYVLWGDEADSPRGRIHLIKLGLTGEARLDETYLRHFDRCLGCMACVTACPSGVQYEPLLEATRAQLARRGPRGLGDRLGRALLARSFPSRPILRAAAAASWLYEALGLRALLASAVRRLPDRLRALDALRPPVDLSDVWAPLPTVVPASPPRRRRVAFLPGCVQAVFFRRVNEATVRVLAREGCEVVVPEAPPCCGALSLHAGQGADARRRARAVVEAFADLDVDHVVVNAAGCGSTMKQLGRVLGDDSRIADRARGLAAKVVDALELLAALPPRTAYRRRPGRVAYHDACHLAHAQGIRDAPREVLRRIPDLELVEVAEPALCCGSAGLYNLVETEAAEALGRRKADHVARTGASTVVAANPGCLLQIQRHLGDRRVRTAHPMELLDEATGP